MPRSPPATDASNTDPYAQKPEANNNWVETGPHVMIVGAKGMLDATSLWTQVPLGFLHVDLFDATRNRLEGADLCTRDPAGFGLEVVLARGARVGAKFAQRLFHLLLASHTPVHVFA